MLAKNTSVHETEYDARNAIPGFDRLRQTFIARLTASVPELQEAVEAMDFLQVKRFGHNLKGTGAPFGFPEITEFGRSIEAGAKAANMGAVCHVMAELKAYLERQRFAGSRQSDSS